jgi:FKBP-type peptidyl-prolyl cis-trans isomerase 2
MRTAQQGDHVQVHYVKRLQDGTVASSRGGAPLELTVGIDHPRLPGLGLALVGLAPGEGASLRIPPEHAYGPSDPSRVHRWSRKRFPQDTTLTAGKWVRFTYDQGRRRLVRILEVGDKLVVVDTNHRGAGQILELEVELLAIVESDTGVEEPAAAGVAGETFLPAQAKAITFDVDAASLASLREAFPGWEFEEVYGAAVALLPPDWGPGAADILVVGARADVSETLALCRFLALFTVAASDTRPTAAESVADPQGMPHPRGGARARRPGATTLVLIPPGQGSLVEAVLEAGAHSCLLLPIHAKDVARRLVHARAANRPGRHTLNLEQAQTEDRWRDDGGQG